MFALDLKIGKRRLVRVYKTPAEAVADAVTGVELCEVPDRLCTNLVHHWGNVSDELIAYLDNPRTKKVKV